MEIRKSSRHSKITGDFSESLVLYWLSKYGFECAKVDHTGIDLIARNNKTNEVMGISVKRRSRTEGTEKELVSIPNADFEKAQSACDAFGCKPYFAIVVDQRNKITMFILSMEKVLGLFPRGQTASGWKMTDKDLNEYRKDPDIRSVEFDYETIRWW
jgi:Holliday junction resolvase-like predicted endonuclease